jgi:hypothetical protein
MGKSLIHVTYEVASGARALMAPQRVFQRGDDDGESKDPKAEQQCTHPALFGSAGDPVTDHTDDGGADIAGPGELISWRRDQNGDADQQCNGCRCG